ncbi:MAG TPA: menaquinone biosynthesis protein [Chthoniobacterales bacterium]|nr:menaquinone biosynthesis protein [Chthoniobacterales bacterium]
MVRLGCVQYLNARPLIHGWSGLVRFGHPSALCRALAAGELDVALVSSFEFLRNPIYAVVDEIAIASDGPVFSVILAHAGSLDQLQEVIIDPASATSVNLLHCLLGERKIQFVQAGELSPRRGRLIIGDQAIRFREDNDARFQILDLGAAWKEQTALPFVYALWLIRPDYDGKHEIAEQLRSLGKNNLQNLAAVIAAQPDADRAFSAFYFHQCLRFTFGEREKQGFQEFAQRCVRQRLLPAAPPAPELV